MVTQLDVVDTFIKVGFGAIITGLTSYVVMRRGHAHEIQKTLLTDKKQLLMEGALKLDKSGSLVNETLQDIYRLLIEPAEDKDKSLNNTLKNLAIAYNEAKAARSLWFMMGDEVLANHLVEYCQTLDDLNKHFYTERFGYDHKYVEENSNKRTEIKNLILQRLNTSFKSVYS